MVGPASTGTLSSDLDYLTSSEQNEADPFKFKLSTLQMCTSNASGALTGVRAIATRVSTEDPTTTTAMILNKYGGVAVTGITCGSLNLDYENGEFVSTIDFSYDTSAMRGIRATTNLGNTL